MPDTDRALWTGRRVIAMTKTSLWSREGGEAVRMGGIHPAGTP